MFGINIKSFKVKFLLLLGSFVFSLFLIYNLSIASTLEQLSVNKQLKKHLKIAVKLPGIQSDTEQVHIAMKDSLSVYEFSLFEMINSVISNKQINIREYSNSTKHQNSELLMVTQIIELSGKYPELIKALLQLEKLKTHFNLSSVTFSKTKNIRTRKQELILRLHYQILANNGNTI